MSDPERPSAIKSIQRSRLRQLAKSPVFLAALGLIAVVGSAFLIGYYDVVNQTESSATTEPSPTQSPVIATVEDTQSTQTPVSSPGTRLLQKRSSASSHRLISSRAAVARLHQQTRKIPTKTDLARRSTSEKPAVKKDPILTAMLKTTWRVLKKPFTF